MPKLTITNLMPAPAGYPAYQLSALQVQDPFPADGRLVIEVAPADTVDTEVSLDQLQRIRPQLVDLETRSMISWSVSLPAEDRRGEESDLMGDTTITYLDTGVVPVTGGAAITGASILGTELLMGYVQAEMTMLDPANALDWLILQAIDTGVDSNTIGIQLISDAGVIDASNIEYAEPATLPSGYTRVLEIHFLPAVFSWATLAVILNDVVNGIVPRTAAFPLGSYRVFCSLAGAGSGADPIDQALAPLVGGTGSALGLVIGDTPANITLHTDTLITYDVDLSGGSTMITTDTAVVRLRATGGGPSVSASIVIA
jgi:hypothetical protein